MSADWQETAAELEERRGQRTADTMRYSDVARHEAEAHEEERARAGYDRVRRPGQLAWEDLKPRHNARLLTLHRAEVEA